MSKTILLIDSNKRSRKRLMRAFIQWGYHVRIAENSASVLALLSASDDLTISVDLAVINNHAQEHSGGLLTQAFSQHPSFRQVPTIVLFFTRDDLGVDLAEQRGAKCILHKPKLDRIRNEIAMLLNEQANIHPEFTEPPNQKLRLGWALAVCGCFFAAGGLIGGTITLHSFSNSARASHDQPNTQPGIGALFDDFAHSLGLAAEAPQVDTARPTLPPPATPKAQALLPERSSQAPTTSRPASMSLSSDPLVQPSSQQRLETVARDDGLQTALYTPIPNDSVMHLVDEEIKLEEIHFSSGVSRLSPGARIKTQRAAQAIRENAAVNKIKLMAFSDTVGSAAANAYMSQRRAEAVANLLVNEGIDRRLIEIISFGESNTPFKTADGVDDPENRCVGIKIVTAHSATLAAAP